VQMIYIDPPYGVKFGSNFRMRWPQISAKCLEAKAARS
jgi:hypothetical protein